MREVTTAESTDMKKIREYYKQLYAYKFDNLIRIDKSLERHTIKAPSE